MAPESQLAHASRLRRFLLLLLLYSEQRMVLLHTKPSWSSHPHSSTVTQHQARARLAAKRPLSEHTSSKHHPHCTCQEQVWKASRELCIPWNSASLGILVWSRQIRRQDKPQGEGQEENKLTVHVEVWSLQGRCPGNLRKELHAQASPMHVCTL